MTITTFAVFAALAASQPASVPQDADVVDAEALMHRRAQELSTQPARKLAIDLPDPYQSLDYDAYRSIRPDTGRRLWGAEDSFFSAEPLHLGGQYRVPVRLDIWMEEPVEPRLRPIAYEPGLFLFPDGLQPLESGSGFAGWRLLSRDPIVDEPAEFLVFHGASYFRAVGRDHGFGTSARAVALRTADPSGEEFPSITRLSLEEPGSDDRSLTIHALLESESFAGVMSMVATPGEETVMDVVVTLYPRRELKLAGIAPLTSMFLFDKGFDARRFDDFRAAVHDADGLQMITGTGERLWRPLTNPSKLQVSAFADSNPRAFGLMQRNRKFEDFGDTEARYERRPSVWIEPSSEGGGWGKGAVTLVEIPSKTEFNDNVVAFWRPETPLAPDQPHRFAYRVRWSDDAPDGAKLMRVVETATGLAPNTGKRLFVIDFEGTGDEPLDVSGLEVETVASTGGVRQARVEALPGGRACRATLEFEPGDGADVSELSLRLTREGKAASERWMHRWTR
ncbi:Glucans biosynthesis protein G precursor [Planctomycetes bacterium Poly30]|uniref:Glucans biosynthesis protein G n=1 Tax=Saltatorellus ferox TaxID=2528018 RepID=A0A518ENX8_9BACT|nr:Glucans biosynthesis protein G precursor [Planctomycetes bacterium Poly30]